MSPNDLFEQPANKRVWIPAQDRAHPLIELTELVLLEVFAPAASIEIRRIKFRPGLNIVWADPKVAEALESEDRTSGHQPHCLLCFLDDDFQADLRLAAQNLSPRHERALQVYALRFQATLENLESVADCPIHQLKDGEGKDNEHFTWWVDEVLKAIRSSLYQQVFAEMGNAYVASITGRFAESFGIVEKLMLDLGIDKTMSDRLDKVLYFRGRKGRFGREDLYHIPYSKRHCISNQRYSVTGQPLLYLGLSILDVAFELGADPQAIDDYSFNTYFLKPTDVPLRMTGNRLQ